MVAPNYHTIYGNLPLPPQAPTPPTNVPVNSSPTTSDESVLLRELINLLKANDAPHHVMPSPSFSGRTEENPIDFLQRHEQYATHNRLSEIQKTASFFNALQGQAATVMQKYRYCNLRYHELLARFNDEFKSEDLLSELRAELYSAKQQKYEPADEFIWCQYAHFQRLAPDEPEAAKARIIRDQLRDSIKRAFATYTPPTINELAEAATRVEQFERHTGGSRYASCNAQYAADDEYDYDDRTAQYVTFNPSKN